MLAPEWPPVQRDALSVAAAFVPRALRAKWVGLVMMLIGLAGTAVWALMTQRLYRSEAVLLFENGITNATNQAAMRLESPRQVGVRLQDMFASRQLLDRVIKEMKLYPRVVEKHGMVEASDQMRAHLKVTLREGYTYRVSYDTDDRDRAQKALARLVGYVIEEDTNRRKRESDAAKKFLDTERHHAEDDLKAKEGELSAFLASHPQLALEGTATLGGLIRADSRDRTATGSGEIASLELQSAQLSAQLEEALSSAGKPRSPLERSGVPLDPVLVAAQARAAADLQAAKRDLSDKESRFTDDHPDVKVARGRVKDAEAFLRQADAALAASVPAKAEPVRTTEDPGADRSARIAALRRALGALNGQIAAQRAKTAPKTSPLVPQAIVAVDTEWTRLSRAVSEARERLNQIEEKQFQAQLVETLVASNQAGGFVVTDAPFRPSHPIAGSRSKIAMLGAVGSLALALLAVFVAGSLDRRLYDEHDIARVVRTEILVVPRLTGKSG